MELGTQHLGLTRRRFCQLSSAAAASTAVKPAFAALRFDLGDVDPRSSASGLFEELLLSWCDGMIAHQIDRPADAALHGGLLCPACGLIHGRCGDSVYPLLYAAKKSGDQKYLKAAVNVHEWSQRQVSRDDGSCVNDVTLSPWKGITVFHAIALGEALQHHGGLLDKETLARWTDRPLKAARFLDSFITIETGNINYPITASYCFALCGQVLGKQEYLERGKALAYTALRFFTENHILFGEGHPLNDVSPKGCRPVDLGYNVEESLPALAMYSVLTGDEEVKAKIVFALQTHMEFMLPDGGWDNSWGSRNYKWSWWGSRTSDGCQPGYVLLSDRDKRFLEVAVRNTRQMAACTQQSLLYGGPDYFAHGDFACIHHTFTHAKALATALDRGGHLLEGWQPLALPREAAYGMKSYPEIGTRLIAVGDWRATVTENDWEYVEKVQSGTGGGGGGHATGGALSVLFHTSLGPLLTASMTEYQIIENSNQQTFRDKPHMTSTPRVEISTGEVYTSLNDLKAFVTASQEGAATAIKAIGELQTIKHEPLASSPCNYELIYTAHPDKFEIDILVESPSPLSAPCEFVLPIVSSSAEKFAVDRKGELQIRKPGGVLRVATDAPHGFGKNPPERTFNLVPGFECLACRVSLSSGQRVRITLQKV